MNRYVIQVSLATLFFVIATAAARYLGSFIKSPSAAQLEAFECDPQPCWHGIRLGETTVPEAAQLLGEDKTLELYRYDPVDTSICWGWQNEWRLSGSGLYNCYSVTGDPEPGLFLAYKKSKLRLGDLIPIVGIPIGAIYCKGERDSIILFKHIRVVAPHYPVDGNN